MGHPYGTAYEAHRVQIVDNDGKNAAKDYYARIGEEPEMGVTQWAKFAFNTVIATGAPKILSNNMAIVHPSSGQRMSIVSTSAEDDKDGGTGIQKILLRFWDSNWVLQNEVIELEGLTEVNTVSTDVFRIEEIRAIKTGTTGLAVGDITVSNVPADTTVYAQINANRAIFERCLHYVAPGNIGVLKSVQASSRTSGGVTFIALADQDFSALGGGNRVPSGVAELELSDGNATYVDLNPALVVDNRNGTTGMGIGVAVVATTTGNQDGSASMNLYEYTP